MIFFLFLGEYHWLRSEGKSDADAQDRTITAKYIDENLAAAHMQLTAEESQHIRDLVTKASVFGNRWPAEHALGLFADTPELEGWAPEKKEAIIGKIMFDKEEA